MVRGDLNREISGTEVIELDATESTDPDGDELLYHWFYYKEAGTYKGNVKISTPFLAKCMVSFEDPKEKGLVHVILDVKDSGDDAG